MNNQNLLKDPRTNWNFVWIVVFIGFVAGVGILGYYYLWIADLEAKLVELEMKLPEGISEDETAIRNLIQNFYKAFEDADGDLLFSYFTSPETSEEKETYEFLTGVDLPISPTYRVFWRISISKGTIREVKLIDKNEAHVWATDELKTYSNIPGGWSDPIPRDASFAVGKSGNNWLIDKYAAYVIGSAIGVSTDKYSGFPQGAIITD